MAEDLAIAAEMIGIKKMGPLALPTKTKRWALLRSPFKHKKSYEHFEMKTHRRLLLIEGDPSTLRKFVDFAVDTMEPIASLKIREHHYHKLRNFYSLTIAKAQESSPKIPSVASS